MKVMNSIEVEHILPRNRGGEVLDWNNFLLSCKYCNTIKNDHNDNLSDYLWPDIDNTDLAFSYSETKEIKPKHSISHALKTLTKNSIKLMGLDRLPGGENSPTESDTRWRSRQMTWNLARLSYNDWKEAPILQMAKQIAKTSLNGHYSIWISVFKNEQIVLEEIDNLYFDIGLYKMFSQTAERKIRTNGNL
jgi:hypothetical protein